nr:hypothetical protein [Tanacetum cinerariifolium]
MVCMGESGGGFRGEWGVIRMARKWGIRVYRVWREEQCSAQCFKNVGGDRGVCLGGLRSAIYSQGSMVYLEESGGGSWGKWGVMRMAEKWRIRVYRVWQEELCSAQCFKNVGVTK